VTNLYKYDRSAKSKSQNLLQTHRVQGEKPRIDCSKVANSQILSIFSCHFYWRG